MLSDIEKIRLEVADNNQGLYILCDEEIQYFLDKNKGNIRKASLDVARAILFKLSIDSSESTVDILTIKGASASKAYKEALMLYLKNPELNPMLSSASIYAGGISKVDMANNKVWDNNYVGGEHSSFSIPNMKCRGGYESIYERV